jgi:hypothetical protein
MALVAVWERVIAAARVQQMARREWRVQSAGRRAHTIGRPSGADLCPFRRDQFAVQHPNGVLYHSRSRRTAPVSAPNSSNSATN